jgi:hypothetical protein
MSVLLSAADCPILPPNSAPASAAEHGAGKAAHATAEKRPDDAERKLRGSSRGT